MARQNASKRNRSCYGSFARSLIATGDETMIWIYIKTESNPDLYTVGFYTPQGRFEPESDHSTRESAAKRVNYLNGGKQ